MPWFPLLTDGLVYFDSLMEGGCIISNISIVEEDSEDAYQSRGELDEWMFINGEVSLMGSASSDSPDISGFKVQTLSQSFFHANQDFCENTVTLVLS
jgi:hypothetical protein